MTDKIVFINDLHLTKDNPIGRLDDVRKVGFEKFLYVLDWAYNHRAIISLGGDLCHKPRSWAILSDLIREIKEDDTLLAVYGQHDTYMYSEETRDATTLGILALEGKIRILGSIPKKLYSGLSNYRFYGAHFGAAIPSLEGSSGDYVNILVIHAPIAEKAVWITQDYMDAMTFLKDHPEFDIIHCGDIHQQFAIEFEGRWIVNSGPMIRREATPYNFQHRPGFWVWDIKEKKMLWEEIPHEPAEKVLTRDHIELGEMANEVLSKFIESVRTDAIENSASIISTIWAIIKENGIGEEVVEIISKIVGERRE